MGGRDRSKKKGVLDLDVGHVPLHQQLLQRSETAGCGVEASERDVRVLLTAAGCVSGLPPSTASLPPQ